MQWLADHLQSIAPAEVLPHITSEPDAAAFLAGLWQMNDFLDISHEHSQSVEGQGTSAAGDYWHAIMHRREPDASNSKYWFRRVGDHPIFSELGERAGMVLSEHSPETDTLRHQLTPGGRWDPFAFVDFCEEAARSNDPQLVELAERLQWLEMLLLLKSTHQDAVGV